jgi:hypothetical protein
MAINKKNGFYFFVLCYVLLFTSCQLKENSNPVIAAQVSKNVHYVVNMTSSSNSPGPVVSYTNQNGVTTQVQQMSFDLTLGMAVGTTAALSATCSGTYNPIESESSASIALKIYVNDTLKAQSNDLKTDPSSSVSASANCGYVIK